MAATPLGRPTTINNVAEFVGLHQLLARAVELQWTGVHVVGDSALILGMMRRRQPPRARRLQHWYRITRLLADRCEVISWTHHYREQNKMVDWLANQAMDQRKSIMTTLAENGESHDIGQGVMRYMDEDIKRWREETSSLW